MPTPIPATITTRERLETPPSSTTTNPTLETAPAPKTEPPPSPPASAAQAPTLVPPTSLPNATATQIAANNNLVAAIPPAPAVKSAAPAKLTPASIAAVAVSVAVMGGYIWIKNYPNMALKVASREAGFEATLPNYLPPSYSLAGDVVSQPNRITLRFNSPSASEPLTLAQTKTSWDSKSLLENYVSRKTDKYLAVQNRGLTIYLYNNNQASWINRGVWYSLEGSNRLNRDQILKIIDSL